VLFLVSHHSLSVWNPCVVSAAAIVDIQSPHTHWL